ncbi:response regulator transcription factor [Micromonospora zhanjiangensis]
MIRTLLALDGALIRGAMAYVLSTQEDIDVIAQLDRGDRIVPALRSIRPDVAVVDLARYDADQESDHTCCVDLPCRVLVLAEPRQSRVLGDALRNRRDTLGFLGNDVSPERVVEGVRRLSRGEPVVDADLVVAALTTSSPLTERESEVLTIAADGLPVVEIADRLALRPGTVRNHLARIAGKTGARTRIETVRIARDKGWI